MGVSLHYIDSCLTAYKEIPKEFRGDLETNQSGPKTAASPGKISIKTAKAIINAQKQGRVSRQQATVLYKAAKSDSRFNPALIPQYSAALSEGSADPLGDVRQVKTVTFKCMMADADHEKLMEKYVTDGPFSSFSNLIKATLMGKVAAKFKFID